MDDLKNNSMEINAGEKKYVTRKNFVSFSLGGFGLSLMGTFINSYLLYFYTDVFMLPLASVTVLMLVARVFDAINDPVMGVIVDKTRTRFGKMRPYLLITIAPIGVITILLFLAPELPTAWKVVYAYATYIMFDLIYTMCDVPMWGLASAITPNPKERLKFISFTRLFHMIGTALPLVLLPAYNLFFKGTTLKTTYLSLAIVSAIVGAVCYSFAFFGTEERTNVSAKSPTIKENLSYLIKNKPLLTVVIANILGFLRAIPAVAGMYLATYFIKNANMNLFIMAAWSVTGYIGVIFSPKLFKNWNFKQLFFMFSIFGAAVCLLFGILGIFVDYTNIVFLVAYMALMGLPYGLICNINYAMIAESVDYAEWVTGERTEGVALSLQTLMNKMMTALQSAVIPLVLLIVAFQAPEKDGVIKEQSKSTLNGMFIMISVLPFVGWVISTLPMLFYKFVGKEREAIYAELAERRAKIEAEKGIDAANDGGDSWENPTFNM